MKDRAKQTGVRIFSDVIWSVLALVLMHGTLQIVVYPYLTKSVGANKFSVVLYILAILGILASSIGLAANNTRLIVTKEAETDNGDYFLAMLPHLAFTLAVFAILLSDYFQAAGEFFLSTITLIMTMLRFYGDVEYRLSLKYKKYLLYYFAISLGYGLGIVIYPYTESWMLCFLLGELLGFLLLLVDGHVYFPLTISKNWLLVMKRTSVLTAAYLLNNTVIYLDRVLLQSLIGGEVPTIYYVASLFGKTAALLVGPLNGVLLGYLTKSKRETDRKQYLAMTGFLLLGGIVLYIGMLLVAPVFTRLLYPEIAEPVLRIAWIANLSQIFCFLASPLLTVLLTIYSERWQLWIQCGYAALFILAALIGSHLALMDGFLLGTLVVNVLYFATVVLLGTYLAGKKMNH